MGKHTYGFPAGTDKAAAISSALQQATAAGYITGPDAASVEIIESDAHLSSDPILVNRGGEEHLVPHAPEFVVVVRGGTNIVG